MVRASLWARALRILERLVPAAVALKMVHAAPVLAFFSSALAVGPAAAR
jgi:hypothetical protein